MHKSEYIHNDLTPDNIMYRNGDYRRDSAAVSVSTGWKLIDFGLMHKVNESDSENKSHYKGSRGWTPPEIVPGADDNLYSYSKDIWSLGLLIIYILCKQQPFTLTYYEQAVLCKSDESKYKDFFFYNKLLQNANKRCRNNDEGVSRNKFKDFVMKKLGKSNAAGDNNLDYTAGQVFLKKYLRKLHDDGIISRDLCGLLANCMLCYDASRRLRCDQIYRHKWFDDVRHL